MLPGSVLTKVSGAALQALAYVALHSLPYKRNDVWMTHAEFLGGRYKKGGIRMDAGCGIKSRTGLRSALRELVEAGLLAIEVDDHDRARVRYRYTLTVDGVETSFDDTTAGENRGSPQDPQLSPQDPLEAPRDPQVSPQDPRTQDRDLGRPLGRSLGRPRRRPAQAALALVGEPSEKPESSEHTRFVALWTKLFEAIGGTKYDWSNKREFAHVRDVLAKQGGYAEAERRARLYLGPQCPSWLADGRDLKGLLGNWNKLAAAAAPARGRGYASCPDWSTEPEGTTVLDLGGKS